MLKVKLKKNGSRERMYTNQQANHLTRTLFIQIRKVNIRVLQLSRTKSYLLLFYIANSHL